MMILLFHLLVLHAVNTATSVNLLSDPPDQTEDCVSLRLREVPIVLQRTKNGDYYLNAKVHDRLRLIFNRQCVNRMACVVYNNANNISKTLTTDGTDADYYLEDSSHGQVKCTRRNSTQVSYSFHLFVDPENGKFFKSMGVTMLHDQRLLVSCLGGYYTEDVKLRVNGEYQNGTYDPLTGFYMTPGNETLNKFYQCEKGDEWRSLIYHSTSQNLRRFKNRFIMKKQSFFFQTQLSCIIEDNDSIPYEEFHVMLACPIASACPTLTQQNVDIRRNKRIFSATFPKNVELTETDYYCVFLKNQEVFAHAFMKLQLDHTVEIIVLIFIVLTIAALIIICNTICRVQYKKLSVTESTQFQEVELLLEDSEKIGEGNSSVIHVVQLRSTGRQVALKYSNKFSQFSREIKMLKNLKHVNVITALGTVVLPIQKSCYRSNIEHIVLPYYPSKSLDQFISNFYPIQKMEIAGQFVFDNIEKNETLTMFELISFGWQISSALLYLKRMKITHRDVAMRNILVGENKIVKLADFERAKRGETTKVSFVRQLSAKFKEPKNIPIFIYPDEAINGCYFYSSEVFSFGNLLLELFKFGVHPPCSYKAYLLRLKQTPNQPLECPNQIYELIVSCMKFNHKQRPMIEYCEGVLRAILRNTSETRYQEVKQRMIDEDRRNLLDELHRPLPTPYPSIPIELEHLFTPI